MWLLVTLCAFVVGFFVGKKNGIRLEQAANTIKSTAKDAAGKL